MSFRKMKIISSFLPQALALFLRADWYTPFSLDNSYLLISGKLATTAIMIPTFF